MWLFQGKYQNIYAEIRDGVLIDKEIVKLDSAEDILNLKTFQHSSM